MDNSMNAHSERRLYVAMEIGNKDWKLAFGDGKHSRLVTIPARDQKRFWNEVAKAKKRFGLSEETAVHSCYEAGRDGFWIDRMLTAGEVRNLVVDPSSIEMNRRSKHVKTDRLDAMKLLAMLMRYWIHGEKKLWCVLHVPSEDEEARRRIHRGAQRLKKEKVAHQARIRSLLATCGVKLVRLPSRWDGVKDWQGKPLAAELIEELNQEYARLALVKDQLAALAAHRKSRMKAVASQAEDINPAEEWTRKLSSVRGVGEETAWNLGHEFFGWRVFQNRRQVGAAAGLTGCPYNSGDSRHEQGISKAGNARVRHWMQELAWRWLMFQPQSALAKWYEERFGHGNGRMRRIGIVALARKLLVGLWKYGAHGECLEGAIVKA